MKKSIKIVLLVLAILVVTLFIIRLVNPREIDDVSPEIPCYELKQYKIDILYVIPFYNERPISENQEWCDYILSLNKTLGIHGISHNYKEFLNEEFSQEDIDFAIEEFEKCFGYKPTIFKAPQLKISKENKELIKSNNLIIRKKTTPITHKVYHCNNGGIIENKAIRIF